MLAKPHPLLIELGLSTSPGSERVLPCVTQSREETFNAERSARLFREENARTVAGDAPWKVEDINPEHAISACWAIVIGEGLSRRRFVPGVCEECEHSDTLVAIETRAEDRDSGECARCGSAGTFIYFEGARDRISLLTNVANAMFPQSPLTSALVECVECHRELELQYFHEDGETCAWCVQNGGAHS